MLYAIAGWVLAAMLIAALMDAARTRKARDWDRRQLKRSITDLECWLEREERKERSRLEREHHKMRLEQAGEEWEELQTQAEAANELQAKLAIADFKERQERMSAEIANFEAQQDHELQRRAYLGDV